MERLSRLDRRVTGKIAIVTGAASGIGRATARLFADEGMRVATLDRDGEGVARVAEEIEKAG
jgi:3-oxoacyl-[acyl-carrier protein] reductase